MESKGTLTPFEDYLIESLQDPKEAQGYLNVSFEEFVEDNDLNSLLDSLQLIATAKGGVLRLEDKAEMNLENLHKLLIKNPTPDWEEVLEALGYAFF